MAMKVVDLEQGTPQWLAWRRAGIGASEAPVIMGLSPWCTPTLLWLRKRGLAPEQASNPRMARGHALEPIARTRYELMRNEIMTPAIAESREFSFIRASFDGLSLSGDLVLEIKCPGERDHTTALNGTVPQKYIPQIMQQLYVAEADVCDYVSYDGINAPVILRVNRDQPYIDRLVDELQRFWDCVHSGVQPTSQTWTVAADQWLRADKALIAAKAAYAEATDALEVLMPPGVSWMADNGVMAEYKPRAGTCDYDRLLAAHKVPLTAKDAYRKKSSRVFDVMPIPYSAAITKATLQ